VLVSHKKQLGIGGDPREFGTAFNIILMSEPSRFKVNISKTVGE